MPTKSKSKKKSVRFVHMHLDLKVEVVHDPRNESVMLNGPDGFTTGWYPYGWWRSHRPSVWAQIAVLFEIKE